MAEPVKKAVPTKKTAAKTAAKKAAPAKKAAAPKQTPMNILYQVPEGWTYVVDLIGINGTRIQIAGSSAVPGQYMVAVSNEDGLSKQTSFGSMPEALRAASKAAKALSDLAKKRDALAAAESDALGFLGTDAPGKPSD